MINKLLLNSSRPKIPSFTGPGPKELIGFDSGTGYFGITTASELIRTSVLINLVNLTAGTNYNTDQPWLKFVIDGVILFVNKLNVRYALSWDSLNKANLIYGNKIVTIGDNLYKVRVLRGADTDPYTGASGLDPVGTHNSEWNRLIYRVDYTTPPSYIGEKWDSLIIGTGASEGSGQSNICQERSPNGINCILRGGQGISGQQGGMTKLTVVPIGTSTNLTGWRPVLELIQ